VHQLVNEKNFANYQDAAAAAAAAAAVTVTVTVTVTVPVVTSARCVGGKNCIKCVDF
jgi:hypothetical protein